MTGFIGTSLQLQSIMTAHSQWLSMTRSIPYWTTSVFSSTGTNDERRICTHIELPSTTSVWRIPLRQVKVKVKVMLRPTVPSASPSWSKAPIGGLRPDSCRLVDVGRSLWRENGSVVCQTQSAVIHLLSLCTIYILQVTKYMHIRHI
jgi:hypothetical protein